MSLIVHSTYGPVFVILPFIPFSLFPFQISEYIMTLVNLICYFFSLLFDLEKIPGCFKLDILDFARTFIFFFPLIFSLGMGNPIGLVTLGAYSLLVFKQTWLKWFGVWLSVILKLFPGGLLPLLLFSWHKHHLYLNFKAVISTAVIILGLGLASYLLFPKAVWGQFPHANPVLAGALVPTTSIYNQSLSSYLPELAFRLRYLV